MGFISLSGQDTLTLNQYTFTGLGDQKFVEIRFPNKVATAKIGKNGNAIFGFNESGKLGEMKIRAIRGSPDDKFLNNLFAQQQTNFAGTVLLQGQFIKKVGDGKGNITNDTYIVSAGIFTQEPDAESDAEGATEQSIVVWNMTFALAPRILR